MTPEFIVSSLTWRFSATAVECSEAAADLVPRPFRPLGGLISLIVMAIVVIGVPEPI
jgi:hypothetical protein